MAKEAKKSNQKNNKKNNPNKITKILSATPTFGQKAADFIAKWAGSWIFIIAFFIFLIIWMIINSTWLIFGRAWDPYPFILLNLALSCLAAIQAPIILMSQNRAAERDRQRFEYDYAVNRKAEREITQILKQLNKIERKIK